MGKQTFFAESDIPLQEPVMWRLKLLIIKKILLKLLTQKHKKSYDFPLPLGLQN